MKLLTLALLLLLPFVHAAEFTIEETNDPQLVERCFLAPADFSQTTSRTVSTSSQSSSISQEKPAADDLFYGQLLDENGLPQGGIEVEIAWVNLNGERQTIRTRTLTRAEAQLFGDPSLEGYYFFSAEKIGSAQYTVSVVQATPLVQEQPPPPRANPTPEPEPVYYDIVPRSEPEQKTLAAFAPYWWLIPLLVILFVAGYFVYTKLIDKSVFREPSFAKSVGQLYKKSIKNFITKSPTLPLDASVRELITELLQNQYCMIVSEEKFVGLVTSNDVLGPLLEKEVHELSIKELLRHPRTISPSTTFKEVAVLVTEYRVLPVIKNGKLLGVVTRATIAAAYDELFSVNPSGAKKLPKLTDLVEPYVTIEEQATLSEALTILLEKKVNTLIVTNNGPVGVLSEETLLGQLMDYQATLDKVAVEPFMTRILSGDPLMSVLDANRMMLDNNIRSLPIVSKNGVVTLRTVVHELQLPLQEYV